MRDAKHLRVYEQALNRPVLPRTGGRSLLGWYLLCRILERRLLVYLGL